MSTALDSNKQSTQILPASSMSATELKQQLELIPLNKENAIKMIVFSHILQKFTDEAKEYLTTRCKNCDDGNYTVGQMSLKLVEGTRTSYSNDKIKELENEIKAEKERIKLGQSQGDIVETKFNSFRVNS